MSKSLAQRWKERCEKGNFSSAVLGKGTISVMGTSGDEPFVFPRISSLSVLDEPSSLQEDEIWAVRQAEEILRAKRVDSRTGRERTVYGRNGSDLASPITSFDPSLEQTIILIANSGG